MRNTLRIFATLPLLRALPKLHRSVIVYVLSEAKLYQWDPIQASEDDDSRYIKPDDVTGAGRYSQILPEPVGEEH